ncbi:aspartyl aminopeptidase [Fibrobacter sp. UWT3]|uniref:M18 family aminopeptidase n=1 Tax=Fibrobacter sp. UWT3 TaxID=1896225 RepID=UPI000BD6FFA1|nr:M18 family aminopeptidase [Fibrobacter sp. UWT3]SOE76336.1 aspartyl aminopeptidase [Fibrobacter sp. UWT3]
MDFFEFLDNSVTPSHTVAGLVSAFRAAGFRLYEPMMPARIEPGKGYCIVRDSSLVAVRTPRNANGFSGFRIALAHTDFPTLKITPYPDRVSCGVQTLHPEIYGSPIFTSWLDRDLGYAGVLAYAEGGEVRLKTFRGDKLFRIPQLAVHLNRGVNQDGLKVNPQTDLDALWSVVTGEKFEDTLRAEIPEGAKLLDFDVQLFDAQKAARGGFHDEWIYSGRLDNLSSCHAIAEAFIASEPLENDFAVACFFNNEEVGSTTREGAGGNFLKSVLSEFLQSSFRDADKVPNFDAALASSLALSIDMAHAVHPNFPQKHEQNHAPILGGGIVLKTNSQMRYASDVESSARLRLLCERAGVALQTFVMRNDMPCGSTVGPAVSASLGIPTVDIGEPMLSMHSIREMTAAKDHADMISLLKEFYREKA